QPEPRLRLEPAVHRRARQSALGNGDHPRYPGRPGGDHWGHLDHGVLPATGAGQPALARGDATERSPARGEVLMQVRRTGWLILLASLWLAGSCYNPNLTDVLYKCASNGTCPEGLGCNDGKHCTLIVPACSRGGIQTDPTTYVCPGDSNSCKV